MYYTVELHHVMNESSRFCKTDEKAVLCNVKKTLIFAFSVECKLLKKFSFEMSSYLNNNKSIKNWRYVIKVLSSNSSWLFCFTICSMAIRQITPQLIESLCFVWVSSPFCHSDSLKEVWNHWEGNKLQSRSHSIQQI